MTRRLFELCNHRVSLLNLSFLARSERSSLNLLVEDLGTCVVSTPEYSVYCTQNTPCLGMAGRHLADETRTDILHCRFA
ncbi:uncharacterized protein N7487_010454 [Penicillium crustosum]|uniref:uncharacterized protein n=1 Tax=Penicillium crustosum TaxID=36656 RepID=UPI0023A6E7A1|nr:uncharacterized protein N7487_010454 [Penicillium crustosum]KAJ5396151.1 hypothetical protein N7487_010454 [Penicillium crustosum]